METLVDLAASSKGVITFRSGEQFWCPVVERAADETDLFAVRYEHDWYAEFRRDGTQVRAGVIVRADGSTEDVVNHDRDIVAFAPGPCPPDMPETIHP